ncbi:MAG TPA: alpha/beta hydrolase family protein [Vicinamibacterales bacterium]|nr:alpha/beta hydrolase family protein [Vicinamibacterales bacterium]
MIARAFHNWERRLASVDTNRRVRPFAWGLDWIGLDGTANGDDPATKLAEFAAATVDRSDEFFSAPPTSDYSLEGGTLRFPSAIATPHAENNTVVGRVFPADPRRAGPRRRAVVVLPQWNADSEGHVGLCQLFARFGVTSVRLSMPYHDARRPKDLERADFIVSPNIGQTLQVNRQAVLDARRIVDWLEREGFDSIGIVGTSLGSCLSMLTMAHEPRLKAGAFNHVSPYFADVVWSGLSTAHVRAGLEGHVDIERLRRIWMPISPWPYVERVRGRSVLLIYARYDLTFPVPLSKQFVDRFRQLEIPHQRAVLPCGHYTTGKSPFKFIDGYHLTRFLVKAL